MFEDLVRVIGDRDQVDGSVEIKILMKYQERRYCQVNSARFKYLNSLTTHSNLSPDSIFERIIYLFQNKNRKKQRRLYSLV